MEQSKVNIHVVPGDTGATATVIHLLEGEAPKAVNLQSVTLKGNIKAVMDFVTARPDGIDKAKAWVLMTADKGTIVLRTDENSPLGTSVEASLQPFPELAQFGINKEQFFSLKELEKMVRMQRHWFVDGDSHTQLLNQLRTFTASVQANLTQQADTRGNKNQAFSKQVTTDIATNFKLSIPVFKGMAPSSFFVDICYDISDQSVRFWLESVELYQLQQNLTLSEMDIQLKALRELGFTVICA